MRSPRHWVLFGSLGFLFFYACASSAYAAQAGEWTLRVKAERAEVRLKAEPSSPIVITLPKGTVVTSWAKTGEWFRVLVEPGREGYLTYGYLAPRDVDVTKRAQGMPDYWPEASAGYQGAGISVRLGGGFLFFPGGDTERGTSGMLERTAAMISSLGDTIEEKKLSPLHSGYDLTGDVIYRLGTKTALGLRAEYIYSSADSLLRFLPAPGQGYNMWGVSKVNAISLRPGFYYHLSLSRLLVFSADGGPVIYFAEYSYLSSYTRINVIENFQQGCRATSLGLQGGVGLEFLLNPRSAIFLEVQGRYARITNLKGEEEYYRWEAVTGQSNPLEVRTKVKGYLYYGESGGFLSLAVHENDSAADGERRAVLDLSGVSLAFGFKLKF